MLDIFYWKKKKKTQNQQTVKQYDSEGATQVTIILHSTKLRGKEIIFMSQLAGGGVCVCFPT